VTSVPLCLERTCRI